MAGTIIAFVHGVFAALIIGSGVVSILGNVIDVIHSLPAY